LLVKYVNILDYIEEEETPSKDVEEEKPLDDVLSELVSRANRVSTIDLQIPNSTLMRIIKAQKNGREFTVTMKMKLDDFSSLEKHRLDNGCNLHLRGVWSYSF